MAKVVAIKKVMKEAQEAEGEDKQLAISDYEAAIARDPLAEKAYDRLMMLYRKEKNYKKELRIINTGIKAFEKFYRSKKSGSKKVAEISNRINRAFGFTDKKGNSTFDPEPIARWKKRRITVEKRIK